MLVCFQVSREYAMNAHAWVFVCIQVNPYDATPKRPDAAAPLLPYWDAEEGLEARKADPYLQPGTHGHVCVSVCVCMFVSVLVRVCVCVCECAMFVCVYVRACALRVLLACVY